MRGYTTAYNVKTGEQKDERKYATGPDEEVGIGTASTKPIRTTGQKGLGTATWEGDAARIGGGTDSDWYRTIPKRT